ncbi:MAG: 3-oxoacyl-[acyl-carrier-protein] reductase [Nitrospirae bacterium]|nr:MAG: 3-oxoacyl-[acyl-carrier-protein] reductase [Nitrospirota bacterium]
MKERVAVVTGGGRGIGEAIALQMADRGAHIVVADLNMEDATRVSDAIRSKGVKSIAVSVDVSNEGSVKELFDKVKAEFGGVDILVNNAGITRDTLILRMKEEDWDSVLNVNLKSVFLCSREAVKLMAKKRYGRIVNMASVVAFMGNPGQANYSASKAGMIGLTKTIAREYASRGITANAVAPGFIKTAMTDALAEDVKNEMLRSIPLGRFGTVDDVANAVLFLASEASGYITGHVIHVNGGMYM